MVIWEFGSVILEAHHSHYRFEEKFIKEYEDFLDIIFNIKVFDDKEEQANKDIMSHNLFEKLNLDLDLDFSKLDKYPFTRSLERLHRKKEIINLDSQRFREMRSIMNEVKSIKSIKDKG